LRKTNGRKKKMRNGKKRNGSSREKIELFTFFFSISMVAPLF